MKMATLYDGNVINRIMEVALRAMDTEWIVYYSPLSYPPALLQRFPNITLAENDLVPPGRLLAEPVDPDPLIQEQLMRVVRSITWTDHDTCIVEYVDTDLSRGSTRIHTALEMPMDEAHADDLDELRAHAGVIVAVELQAMGEALEIEPDEDDDDDD